MTTPRLTLKKQMTLSAAILSILVLMATTVVPAYAQAQTIEVETATVTMVHEGIPITAKRHDIFRGRQHLIQIVAEVEVDGQKISIKSEPYSFDKLYSTTSYTTQSSFSKFRWDGILFVRAPGSSTQWIKYDHPDNFETYYPNQINKGYTLNGYSKQHNHIAQYALEEAKANTSFARIAGMLAAIIAALLALPELISKIVAGIIGLIGAILVLVGFVLYWFINDIIQTERGDGWIWTWGYTQYWFLWWRIGISWWMSFGAWRDWGFFVYVPM